MRKNRTSVFRQFNGSVSMISYQWFRINDFVPSPATGLRAPSCRSRPHAFSFRCSVRTEIPSDSAARVRWPLHSTSAFSTAERCKATSDVGWAAMRPLSISGSISSVAGRLSIVSYPCGPAPPCSRPHCGVAAHCRATRSFRGTPSAPDRSAVRLAVGLAKLLQEMRP